MRAVLALTLILTAAPIPATAAASDDYPALSRDQELRLAMSAGPLELTAKADVWVLGEHGFERVIEGTNGFACMVVRSAGDRDRLAPICFSPAAVESVMPAMLREGELQMQGLGAEAIETEMQLEWSARELPVATGPAYAYMFSAGQRIGPDDDSLRPHFMLFVPYLANADIGGDPSRPQFPFVGPREYHPLSSIVVFTEQFVRPEDVVLPER